MGDRSNYYLPNDERENLLVTGDRWPARDMAEIERRMEELDEVARNDAHAREWDPEDFPDYLDDVAIRVPVRAKQGSRHCSLGVGCDEVGICYAVANGKPDQCGAIIPGGSDG